MLLTFYHKKAQAPIWRFLKTLIIGYKVFLCYNSESRRGVRVVEGARLESVYAGNRIWGSNPHLSAIFISYHLWSKKWQDKARLS